MAFPGTTPSSRRFSTCWRRILIRTWLAEPVSRPQKKCPRGRRQTLAAGGVRSTAGRRAIDEMDSGLRDARNLRNPGTTADLTTAAIFVELLRSRKCKVRQVRKLGRR